MVSVTVDHPGAGITILDTEFYLSLQVVAREHPLMQ